MTETTFNGLTMPVFNAFGWAEEEAAIAFALSEMALFTEELHRLLPTDLREILPHVGVDRVEQLSYLAAKPERDEGIQVTFAARPLTFTISLALINRRRLSKLLRAAESELDTWHLLLSGLDADWMLRVQQMQIQDGDPANYQDVFKESVSTLTAEKTKEISSRAHYLNGEEKWLAPIFLSRRFNSEQVSGMGAGVTETIGNHLRDLMPLISWMDEKISQRKATLVEAAPTVAAKEAPESKKEDVPQPVDTFSYVAELKPLHIRRGFINLTPDHWPFFAKSARSETQKVMVNYGGKVDKDCAVWRLVQNDLARLVLTERVQRWLSDNFDASDRVQVDAAKMGDRVFHITLSAAS